jgi:ParB/RepB/Spo0J family partition protein
MAVSFPDMKTQRGGVQPVLVPPDEISKIVVVWNSRHNISAESITELAHQIASSPLGQIDPIVLRKGEGNRPELVAGNRRKRAIEHINANLPAFQEMYPDRIKGPLSLKAQYVSCNGKEAKKLNISENRDRLDLSPIDLAFTARDLEMDGWAREEIANTLRISVTYIPTLLSYLQLPDEAREAIHRGEVSGQLGKELVGLPDREVRETVKRVSAGEVRSSEAAREVRERKRSNGQRVGLSLKELKDRLKAQEGKCNLAFDLLCVIRGDHTQSLEQILEAYDLPDLPEEAEEEIAE